MEFFINLNTTYLILLSVLLFSGLIQLFFYLFFYIRIYRNKISDKKFSEKLSVIICARNEAENLKKYIPLIANQNYKDFEIVVVNDCSIDHTEYVLDRLEKQYKHLRHTTIKEDSKFSHGKKLALTIGIKSAKNEHLVLTDADCYPASNNWLNEIANGFSNEIKIVISYGAFEKENSFLNKLIRYDNFFNSLQFLSFAKAGLTYMGTGRNMAYKKSIFLENKGFASHYNIMSGDDDLFVNEVATKHNTKAIFSENSFTYTPAKKLFSKWFLQKFRHLSTAKKYKFIHKFLLSLEPFSRMLFYLLSVFLTIFSFNLFIVLFIILVIIIKLIVIKIATKKLLEKDLFIISLLFDMFLPIFYLFLHAKGIVVKRRKWS